LIEIEKLSVAFDFDADVFKAFYEQALVLVLGKDQCVGIGTDTRAHRAKRSPCFWFSFDPNIDRSDLPTPFNDSVAEPQLPVKLESPGLHSQGARRSAGFGSLVYNPNSDPSPGQPKRQHESRWPSADDQDLRGCDRRAHYVFCSIARTLRALYGTGQQMFSYPSP
jgi:hypothetical protein